MKRIAIFLLVLATSVAAADEDHPGLSLDQKGQVYEIAGGTLVTLSAASALAATVYGPIAASECGFFEDNCSGSGDAQQAHDTNIAIGLAAAAAVTAAIGIPLLIKGGNLRKEAKHSLSFGLAPTMTNQVASGATASMTLRF